MTPTANDLREVGLRPCVSTFRLRVRYRANERHGRIVGVEEYAVSGPKVGQRTRGEYWRRRRMVDDMLRDAADWFEMVPEQDRRTVARGWCIVRGWKAWPKSGWRRKGKGQR